jgi:type II secretory pathway component PulC
VAGRATIARAELAAVLAGGLGRFLGRVETEPARENGQFVGFRIVALEGALAANDASGTGVRAGDVIVRVNGQIIERPEQALAVWEGLRVASTLAIEYLRAGQRREARFEIVD